jgi:hypothetical protein
MVIAIGVSAARGEKVGAIFVMTRAHRSAGIWIGARDSLRAIGELGAMVLPAAGASVGRAGVTSNCGLLAGRDSPDALARREQNRLVSSAAREMPRNPNATIDSVPGPRLLISNETRTFEIHRRGGLAGPRVDTQPSPRGRTPGRSSSATAIPPGAATATTGFGRFRRSPRITPARTWPPRRTGWPRRSRTRRWPGEAGSRAFRSS